MGKSISKKYSKRLIFPSGRQRKFLLNALQNLNVSWLLFAEKIGVHERTLNDWKREKYSMPLDVAENISKISKIKIPKNTKTEKPFWYVYKGSKMGSKKGAAACFKKYGSYGGDPEYRKKKWYEWWEREGKYKSNIISAVKPIKRPKFSEELAEFVGIILGDGSIGKSQISITFHSENDKEYGGFVVSLIKKLFNVYVGTCLKKNFKAVGYNISRTELIRFCTKKLGLKQGNKIKQQVDIPEWIKRNKRYSVACARGLMDTDGCIFIHKYKVNGKQYSYKKLSFRSYSEPLFRSMYEILRNIGLTPRIAGGNDLRIDSKAGVQSYFRLVGSNNPKHLKKFRE